MNVKETSLVYASKLLKSVVYLLGSTKGDIVSSYLADKLVPIVSRRTPAGVIRFYCPAPLPEWRARSILIKEPETLEWIDDFRKGEVFWDVGANVGVFSLYAAFRHATVYAFEPSA